LLLDTSDGEPSQKSSRLSEGVDEPANEQEEQPNAVDEPVNGDEEQPPEENSEDAARAKEQGRLGFLLRWREFLKDKKGENEGGWHQVYEAADRVHKKGGPFEYPPNGTDDAAEEVCRVRINKALESAIGQAWQSRIDKASESDDGNHNGVERKRLLQFARGEAMRRA
jgi:hypothetical protein